MGTRPLNRTPQNDRGGKLCAVCLYDDFKNHSDGFLELSRLEIYINWERNRSWAGIPSTGPVCPRALHKLGALQPCEGPSRGSWVTVTVRASLGPQTQRLPRQGPPGVFL